MLSQLLLLSAQYQATTRSEKLMLMALALQAANTEYEFSEYYDAEQQELDLLTGTWFIAAMASRNVLKDYSSDEDSDSSDEEEYSSDEEENSSDEESESILREATPTSHNTQTAPKNCATSAPQRKRTRTAKTDAKPAVKWSRGDLNQLLNMSPDIFLEIARHLTPPDLLTLARSTKFFRAMFMSRSAAPIWQRAISNVVGLPTCPASLCAPQYVSLIYSKTCSECGARAMRRMDTRLHVRLCTACRTNLVEEMPTDDELYPMLPTSRDILPERAGICYCLTRDLQSLRVKISDLHHNNQPVSDEWKQFLQRDVKKRNKVRNPYQAQELQLRSALKHAMCLDAFLDGMKGDRASEIQQLKDERKLDIEERLYDAGWTSEDMDFPTETRSQWNKLVLRPQPLTDRMWSNLYPKLVLLLEANRNRIEQSA
ncbi:hypothetical protein FRC12_019732 [Ceratobasidium sp. 428]|nr:hypothetical protein FRC12_019732 [Ceratobasidium sp. 428]